MTHSTVQVVDEEEMIRRSLARIDRGRRIDVLTANDGEAAATALSAATGDIVLVDLGMLPLDGYGLLRWMQARGKTQPVLICSGCTTHTLVAEALHLGAYASIARPFNQVIEYLAKAAKPLIRESVLAQIEQLVALRKLAAAIVHNIKTFLLAIQGCLRLIADPRSAAKTCSRYPAPVESELNRATAFIRSISLSASPMSPAAMRASRSAYRFMARPGLPERTTTAMGQ